MSCIPPVFPMVKVCSEGAETAWRRSQGYVEDVASTTSGRNLGYVGTQFGGRSVELIVCSTEHQRMYVKPKM